MIQMKKKLLAVVLAVVMIAALIVPMMAISAADAPTATIGLGTPYKVTRTKNDLTKDCIAIDVLISGNGTQQGFFTARYAVISEEGLEHYYAPHANAAKSDKGADLGDFTDGDATLPIDAGQLSGEGKTWFQVVHLSDKAFGVYKDSGKLVTVYFVLPEKVGTYNFTLDWMDGTNDAPTQYDMTVNPATATYTVECTEHKEGEAEVVEAADCIKAGKKVVKCTVCDKVLKEEVIPALGHDLDDGVVAEGVKCGETADTTYSCKREGCDYTKVETGAKVEHAMVVDEENSKAATCDEDGVEATKCSREGCDHKETKTIAKLGHNMESDQAAGEAPTCDKDGKVVDKCTRCGKVEETPIPALGHDMVADEENSKEATCYAEGVEAKKCSRCDKTETKAIPKTEHAFDGEVKVITAPTAEAEGKYTVACSNEGCTEVEEKTAAKLAAEVKNDGLVIKAEGAILPEDIYLDLVEMPVVDGKKVTAKFAFTSELVDALEGEVTVAIDATGAKNFKVTTVNAAGETVEVEAVVKDGNLTFAADLAAEYTIAYEQASISPETDDATNVAVFAVVALMAVAGLVVVGKKRFAL